jgi:hypothetical protein
MASPTATPTLDQIMSGLIREVRFGKAALRVAVGLNYTDSDIWNVAPMFFGLARQANLEVAQMYLARLYDRPTKTREPVTVRTLLKLGERQPELFTKGTPDEVIAAAKECRKIITSLREPLASIETRRNEALAHLDKNSVMNPGGLKQTAPLSMADLQRMFDETENILRKMDRFYSGLVGEIFFLEQDDYRAVLKIIAEAKRKPPVE